MTEPKKVIKIEPIGGTWDEVLEAGEELNRVRVIIRCGRCGRIVSRSGMAWGGLRGKLSCKEHGQLGGDMTVGDLHAEWTRRNRPASFTIKRNPID